VRERKNEFNFLSRPSVALSGSASAFRPGATPSASAPAATALTPLDDLATLRDPGASLSALMAAVDRLERHGVAEERAMRVAVSANVTTDLFTTFMRRHALLAGRTAQVTHGSYDAHIDNARAFANAGVDHLLVLNFLDNLMPAFESRFEQLGPETVTAQRERVAAELRLALGEARSIPAVHVGLFHRLTPTAPTARSRRIDALVESFNGAVESVCDEFPNAAALPLQEIVAAAGHAASFDPRFYLRFKAPYTARFWDELARRLILATRAGGSRFHKALVLDCDNTLWGGVVGEDDVEGLELGPDSYPGNVFWRAQAELLELQRAGVLLCLATKNEPADLDAVLTDHPHQLIRDEHLVVKKAGWGDKVDSLVAIARELDIGLDSLVFLDDSEFECEAVRERLPMVTTFTVPRNACEYPALVRELCDLFLAGRAPEEAGKTEQYRVRAAAREHEATGAHATREEYLASLGIEVELRRDPRDAVPRIAQLTQKSNQFNLTTRRYTEAQVADLVDDAGATVYTLGVRDRFGDSGLTGVAIVRFDGTVARLDSFLMSCRVLGRGIELFPWPAIVADARARGCDTLAGDWLRTPRNAQVERFLDGLGLACVEAAPDARRYEAPLDGLSPSVPTHIEVN
jgi:FkbH-like protein